MSEIRITDTDTFFLKRQATAIPHFTAEDYLGRVTLLLERMKATGTTHVIIYGDREHFSNIEYFSGYDCRFEEGLLIIDNRGNKSILVGNEGMGYSYQIPYKINRLLYQQFSLQGQPRDQSPSLTSLLKQVGISTDSRVGVVGYKYFYAAYTTSPATTYDLPMYMMDAIFEVAGRVNVSNFTEEITGLPDGIRMRVRTPKEVAWAEYSATKCAGVLLNMLDGLEDGIEELELSRKGKIDFSPVCMFGLVNFGAKNASLGLRSPDDSRMKIGEVCGLCYGTRGSLCSRTGVSAYDLDSYSSELRPTLETFYKPFWMAISTWYETMRSGASAGGVYKAVMDLIGGPEFGVTLNPGHNTGMDEWTNSPIYRDSPLSIPSGTYMQCDIIGTSNSPMQTAICEDTVIVADKAFRDEIRAAYPDLSERIEARQKKMREVLGIQIDDSLLPMSNLNGVYFPFMMDKSHILAK